MDFHLFPISRRSLGRVCMLLRRSSPSVPPCQACCQGLDTCSRVVSGQTLSVIDLLDHRLILLWRFNRLTERRVGCPTPGHKQLALVSVSSFLEHVDLVPADEPHALKFHLHERTHTKVCHLFSTPNTSAELEKCPL